MPPLGHAPGHYPSNNQLITKTAFNEGTGGYNPQDQLWQKIASIMLPAGQATIHLESAGPFPHLDKLAFAPASR